MGIYFIISNLLKNYIMFFLKNILTQRGTLGLDGHTKLVMETLNRMGHLTGDTPINVKNELVYEMGPGRTPYLMMAFALIGAKRVVGLDVHNWMNNDLIFRQVFFDIWSEKKNKINLFLDGFCAEENVVRKSLNSLLNSNSIPIQYSIYPGDLINEEDNRVQLLYSKSVLEHVKLNKIEKALKEHYRIIKKGGYALHIIDLRDHLFIKGDEEAVGEWLNALRYPEWLHNALTSNRRAYINRIRSNAWKKLFLEAGFDIVYFNESHDNLHPSFSKEKLSVPFSSSEEDFSVSWIDVLLRK